MSDENNANAVYQTTMRLAAALVRGEKTIEQAAAVLERLAGPTDSAAPPSRTVEKTGALLRRPTATATPERAYLDAGWKSARDMAEAFITVRDDASRVQCENLAIAFDAFADAGRRELRKELDAKEAELLHYKPAYNLVRATNGKLAEENDRLVEKWADVRKQLAVAERERDEAKERVALERSNCVAWQAEAYGYKNELRAHRCPPTATADEVVEACAKLCVTCEGKGSYGLPCGCWLCDDNRNCGDGFNVHRQEHWR